MKLILKQDVDNLGESGEIVDVKDGYGRNYLIPKGFAIHATESTIRAVQEEKRQQSRKIEAKRENADKLAQQLAEVSVTISVKAGEDGKIFGTVTSQQLTDALNEKGFDLDRRKVTIDGDVKSLGEYTATVDLHAEVKAQVKFWVVKAD